MAALVGPGGAGSAPRVEEMGRLFSILRSESMENQSGIMHFIQLVHGRGSLLNFSRLVLEKRLSSNRSPQL